MWALVLCCAQVLSEARQASLSSESLICGVTSNSLPGATPGGGTGDEDMQTYIVQVRSRFWFCALDGEAGSADCW